MSRRVKVTIDRAGNIVIRLCMIVSGRLQTAVIARAILSSLFVRLSICPPYTFRCFVQKNEDTIVRFADSGRKIILVSGEVNCIQIFSGDHPQRRH